MNQIQCHGEEAIKSAQWVRWADNDYVAARQLLLTDMLVQGCSLSNTCIEKYLKALFMISGLKVPRGHNIFKLNNAIKENGLKLDINEEYLALLFRSYRLRYPDDLPSGFNVALNRTKLLVELDHTVYEIRKGFNFEIGDKKITIGLELLQEKKDPVLLNKNCYFGNYERAALFGEESSCYELRVLGGEGILEAHYRTAQVDDDGKFDVEGLKPGSSK